MKSTFDKTTRAKLIKRINTVNENSKALWGKMNVYQMLKHCTTWEEWLLKKEKNKQQFIGKLFGRMALKSLMKDESPLRKNTPTLPSMKIKGSGDVEAEKKKWITLLEGHAHFSNPGFVHDFFGEMTEEQIGYMAYKHADHHLRQFNC